MEFDNDLVVGKLRRWEKYLAAYRLPAWEQIPPANWRARID